MKTDYHMHLEFGEYTLEYVENFLENARLNSIDEIGFSEHSHGFFEFKELYEKELILDNSAVGIEQQKWLQANKFRYSLKDYFDLLEKFGKLQLPIKKGIEVCNFIDQSEVKRILGNYKFDYIIGSVHFLKGWAFDHFRTKFYWDELDVNEIYQDYVDEIIRICNTGLYDILGHPFNIRLFKIFPTIKMDNLLLKAAKALKDNDMTIDVNTGTLYRYEIKEISPYKDFLKIAKEFDIPIIISSDAHSPKFVGKFMNNAIEYVKSIGYDEIALFEGRNRKLIKI